MSHIPLIDIKKEYRLTAGSPHPITISHSGRCDICRLEEQREIYDARTISGQWGWICKFCFASMGIGLGIGKGQKYERI